VTSLESASSTPRARRWWSFPRTAMLRLRLSWMRSRRMRKERRLEREERRLRLYRRLAAEQMHLLRRLERELHPLLEPETLAPEPPLVLPPPLPEPPSPEALDQLLPIPEPEPTEPMPDPLQEIAQRLGLQPPPT